MRLLTLAVLLTACVSSLAHAQRTRPNESTSAPRPAAAIQLTDIAPAETANTAAPVTRHITKHITQPTLDSRVDSISVPQADASTEALYQELSLTANAVANDLDSASVPMTTPVQVDAGWWHSLVPKSLRQDAGDIPLSLEEALHETLMYSEQIKVFRKLPPIRRTAVVEAAAAFDWNAFMEAQWDDLSDPIGNSLTAGPGISRFRDHHAYGSTGVRKRTWSGGEFEVAQYWGWQDNNSRFFVPDPQGTSRIALNFTQPLLRGRGKVYNQSLICLAQIDVKSAHQEVMRQLQTHLLEVGRAYWAIYLERGVLYQKLRSYDRAKKIVDRLRLRQTIDAPLPQIQAAEAALAERRSDLARAFTAVKNAEARLRALVNSPRYGEYESLELVPIDQPSFDVLPVDIEFSLAEAIQARPEIRQALYQLKSSSVRLGMARHELLPILNLVTSTYVAGLADEGDVGQAWVNQFNQGEPGYTVGFQFEVPLGNRAACARRDRRKLEYQQAQHQYRVTMNTVSLEVKVAVREIQTAENELLAKQQVVAARGVQLEQIVRRWERLPGDNTTTNLVLDNILRAQDDLAEAEYEYLQAQITYNLSRINLRKATGTLVQHGALQLDTPISASRAQPGAETILPATPGFSSN